MVTISCSIWEAAIIADALRHKRDAVAKNLKDESREDAAESMYYLGKIDRLLSRTGLEAPQAEIYDALGVRVR